MENCKIVQVPCINIHIKRNGNRYGYRTTGSQPAPFTGVFEHFDSGWHNMKRLDNGYGDSRQSLWGRVQSILWNAKNLGYEIHIIDELNNKTISDRIETFLK